MSKCKLISDKGYVHEKGITFLETNLRVHVFWKGDSQNGGLCEPPQIPRLRACVGANSAYAMTLFAYDSVVLIRLNTRYHNVDPAFLVYYVPGI